MGLQVLDEFWPITPVRTHPNPIERPSNHRTSTSSTEVSDLEITKLQLCSSQQHEDDDDVDCHTPTSPSRTLTTPLVCPPAPKKPRPVVGGVTRRSLVLAPPSQGFFQVPRDLASVFLPSNKIRATS